MSTILDKIVASTRSGVAQAKLERPEAELRSRLSDAPPVRPFGRALAGSSGVALIAEVKRASPAAGLIRGDFDPVAIASEYTRHGACAISVLTDAPFFQGSIEHLARVRDAVGLPVLRKDFIVDPYQVFEARVSGADAVLLIAEILPQNDLVRLLDEATRLGMDTLVELYDADNLDRVLETGCPIVGINNRNLQTFETEIEHTVRLAGRVPRDRVLVSESGIRTRNDVEQLLASGVRAILVGETLMRAHDIGGKIRELLGHPAC